jgi:ABC-type Na+ efflux pump permease subunit
VQLDTVLRIARWEVLKGTDSLTRRTVLVAVAAVALSGALGMAVSSASVSTDAGLYVVGVEESNPYYDVAAGDDTFVVRDPGSGRLGEDFDIVANESGLNPADTRKGQAALSEFRGSVRRHNDRVMDEEDNESAAFPLVVRMEYAERQAAGEWSGGSGEDDGGGGGGGGVPDGGSGDEASDDGGMSVPQVGGQPLFASTQEGRPGAISPPFPFGALLLAFAFVVPLNFVIQAFGASVLRERIDRRGELMLVAPVSAGDVVAGKTLPYLLLTVAVSAGIALSVGGGPLSVAAVLPIALLFLATTFLAAMFARSFKELTFLTVTISVGLTSYVFVPAIFTEVTPIALISPLTLVVRDVLGQGATPGQYLFSTGPFYCSAAVLFLLGMGTYREEDMFSQRPVHLKALDALARWLRGTGSVVALTAAFIPFVLVGELLAVALLYALPLPVTIPALFLAIAVVEELAKSVHVFAGFVHERFPDTDRAALAVGLASGLGFFLGEKLLIVVQVVGLPELFIGRLAFPSATGLSMGSLGLLLAGPVVLHTTTATVSALGARRSARWYAVAFGVAVVWHFLYNLGVIALVA